MDTTDRIDAEALRQSIRDVLDAECNLESLRRHINGDAAVAATLQRNAAELGWHGIAIPEEFGGLGMGYRELMTLHHEIGHALAPLAVLPTALGAEALVRGDNAALRETWLPRIAAGAAGVTVALPPATLNLRSSNDRLVLDGTARHVLCADPQAPLILFAQDDAGRLHAVLAEAGDAAVTVTPTPTVDRTRQLADIRCVQAELSLDRLISTNAAPLAEALLRHAALALACDAVGGGQRIFDLTVEYLNTRVQFGRQIGSFQALKHRCANLKIELQGSSALTAEAVTALDSGAADAPAWVAMAKSYACDAYAHTAADAVQLHGGIGFTWEHHCHLFLKRAKLSQFLFGDSAWHRDHAFLLLLQAA